MNVTLEQIRSMVRRATRRTGRPVADDDLDQEAALRAIEALRRADRVVNEGAFVCKVVEDTVRDHWRTDARTRLRLGTCLDDVDEWRVRREPTVDQDLDHARQLDCLHRALDQLDGDKRWVLEMFYWQNMTVEQIARERQCSASAVKMNLLRSRRRLIALLGTLSSRGSPTTITSPGSTHTS